MKVDSLDKEGIGDSIIVLGTIFFIYLFNLYYCLFFVFCIIYIFKYDINQKYYILADLNIS